MNNESNIGFQSFVVQNRSRVLAVDAYKKTTNWLSDGKKLSVVSTIFLFVIFPAISITEQAVSGDWDVFAFGVSVWLSACIVACLVFPVLAWNWLTESARYIDDLVAEDEDVVRLTSFLDGWLSLKRQLGWSFFLSLVGLTVFSIAGTEFSTITTFQYSTYVQVAILGALLANSVYWIFVIPRLARILEGQSLKFVYLDPVETPGIREFSNTLARSTMIAFFAMNLAVVPLYLFGRHIEGQLIEFISFLELGLGSALIVYLLFLPQIWIKDIVYSHKVVVLRELSEKIETQLGRHTEQDVTIGDLVALHQQLARSPNWPINFSGIANYLVVLAASFVIPILQFFM